MSDIIARLRAVQYGSDRPYAASVAADAITEIERLRKALGEQFCPRPCNHRPDEFSVADCVSAGECGCSARAALGAIKEG